MASVKILIVDNDRAVTRDLQERLIRLGYEVAGIATTSDDAITQTNNLKPNLVIMNIRLHSGRDGIKTGSLIHSTSNTPIIYFSSQAGQETVRRAGSTGSFGHIIKPFDDSQLFVTIEVARVRYKLESQLRESEQWLNGVLMSIGDGVIAADNLGKVRFINSKAEKITGWSQTDATGMSLLEVLKLKDETSGELIDPSSRLFQAGDAGLEALLTARDGLQIHLEINLSPLIDQENHLQGLVFAFRDISSRRQAMEQIQRQTKRAEALVEIAKQLNLRLDLKELLEIVCRITNQALRSSASVVFLFDQKSSKYLDMARRFEDELPQAQRNPVRMSFSRTMLDRYMPKDHSSFFIQNAESQKDVPMRNLLRLLGINHLAVAPLVRNQDVIGALVCGSIREQGFSQDDRDFLNGLAEHIMIAISNTRLFEHVRLGRERQRMLSRSNVDIQEAERRRIARELHDHLGQSLTGFQFMLESVKHQVGEAQKPGITEIQSSVADIIEQVREMSLNLRPSILDDLGLVPTVKWHIDRYTKQTGIHVNFFSSNSTERFPAEIETTAYRIEYDTLTLLGAEGKPLAQLKAQADRLAGTAWQVTAVNNGRQAVVGV
ncbi:MAG: response regulator, partial [Anaerolineales bacterium]|nr:response regulator [Anaerolineales bacterium]